MAINFVDVTSNNAQSTTTLSVDYPVNSGAPTPPRDGQLMLLAISFSTALGSDTTVTGWTSINSGFVTAGAGSTHLYYKQGDGSTGSATINFSTSCRVSAAIALFDGLATSSPVDVALANGDGGGSNTTATGQSLATTTAGDMLFAAFGSISSGSYFGEAGGMVSIIQIPGSVSGKLLTLDWEILGAAGNTGTRTCTCFDVTTGNASTYGSAVIVMAAIKAFNGPTSPVLTAPITGETITVGRTYSITWTPSTDPVIAQSALQYHLRYSLNDGLSWTDIVALTSAGVTTYAWNTTGIAASSQVRMEARAWNGTTFSPYYETGRFTLAADVTPSAPSNLHGEQPDGTTVTLFDLAQALVVKGVFVDLGDVMTGFQLDWGTDGVTYANTSTTNSAIFSKTYSGATFSAGLVYFRCKTKDNAGTYGPYSYFQITAANAPAAPNITAPTASVPPNRPLPTISWTSTAQVKYRITIRAGTIGGSVVYSGAFVTSSITSIPSPYSFLNNTQYTLSVDYQDASGLTSPKDSETFTVLYQGPLKPSISVA